MTLSDMAARSDIHPRRWRRPFLRLLDGTEAGWAVPLLLTGFVAVWMAFLAIAYLVGDLHSDVLETWTFGRTFEWGSSKHPPLMGWIARAWTSVFPLADWSFQLLALVNSAIALWAVDLISRRFVRGDKRIVVLLLLMLPPTYQLFAQRFNANAVLLAVWPIATYCFLRSFETRELKWAVAAGATAALAMLGKYYSVFLIGSFVFAALCHPRRQAYFRSPAPWISAGVGLVALAPHLFWLATTGGMPIIYALKQHAGKEFVPALREALLFLLGAASGLVLPAALWVAIAGRRLKMLPRDFRKMDPGLFLLFLIAVGTIAFPAVTAVVVGANMPGIWASQGLFLFCLLAVCSTTYPIERFYSVNLIVIVAGIALVAALVVAPLHAYYRNTHPLNEGRNFYRLSVIELTRRWHKRTSRFRLWAATRGWRSRPRSTAPIIPCTKGSLSVRKRMNCPRRPSLGGGRPYVSPRTMPVSIDRRGTPSPSLELWRPSSPFNQPCLVFRVLNSVLMLSWSSPPVRT